MATSRRCCPKAASIAACMMPEALWQALFALWRIKKAVKTIRCRQYARRCLRQLYLPKPLVPDQEARAFRGYCLQEALLLWLRVHLVMTLMACPSRSCLRPAAMAYRRLALLPPDAHLRRCWVSGPTRRSAAERRGSVSGSPAAQEQEPLPPWAAYLARGASGLKRCLARLLRRSDPCSDSTGSS